MLDLLKTIVFGTILCVFAALVVVLAVTFLFLMTLWLYIEGQVIRLLAGIRKMW